MIEARNHKNLTQLDLFRIPPTIPDWERLPPDVRRQTVILLARMLRLRPEALVAADHGREVGDE
jgi:hypothetical protein